MGVNLEQYRACIGSFNFSQFMSRVVFSCHFFFLAFCWSFSLLAIDMLPNLIKFRFSLQAFQFFYTLFSLSVIMLSGDIELNPGTDSLKDLSICHWNLNSILADDFSKVSQISAFLETHKFDIFCICEGFLDSSIGNEDPGLAIDGYHFFRCDHPSNTKRGGVILYYRDHLPIIERPELTNLDECLVCELKAGSNRLFICLCYRSPSQDADHFILFKQKWEETITNIHDCSPTLSIFLGDLNARNSEWCVGDITNVHSKEIADLASQHGLYQVIDEATHILPSSLSCIDLIFISAKNFLKSSGVIPSLYPSCHHQLTFAKFNFKIPFPPAYQRRIWNFSRADSKAIKQAVNLIDWDSVFLDLTVDRRVSILTQSVLNIFSNFVPNKVIVVKNKDAPWMTPDVKRMILEKAKIYRHYVKNARNAIDHQRLRDITSRCKRAVNIAKENYLTKLGNILNEPNISPKKYWSTLNRLIHKRKITRIPQIRNTNNIVVTEVSHKADVFNTFFANQCSLMENDSVLPPLNQNLDNFLGTINFDKAKILAFIRALDSNKAHGWDGISIRMVKICDESLLKPLMNIFRHSLASGKFPTDWKKGNIVPIYKKGDKSIVKNYRPVSLLPILSKIFEKCIYDTLYNYFEERDIFSTCQSGFRKGDSCVSQLISITHNIFKGFDANPSLDTRGVFLDISKAFDRVWHDGLIFKLHTYGIHGPLLSLLRDFLSDRVQRVTLDGHNSTWIRITAGVPQGSILGPLFFLI